MSAVILRQGLVCPLLPNNSLDISNEHIHSWRMIEPAIKYLFLETTTRCNLRCVHCLISPENNSGHYDFQDLSIPLFNKVLSTLQEFHPTVQLNGHGETLLHPQFLDMVEGLRGSDCEVSFQTNGMLLTRQIIERVVTLGVQGLAVSIDAADPDLYAEIRRHGQLKRVLENLRAVNEVKEHLNSAKPRLAIEFVAMRQNIQDLPILIKMAGGLKVSDFIVAELVPFGPMMKGQSLANDPLMAEWAIRATEEARKWEINLYLPPHIPGKEVLNPIQEAHKGRRKDCRWPWERMFIRATGKIQPCCVIGDSYGELTTQSFEEIWYGRKYRELRKSLASDEPLPACVTCPISGWETVEADPDYEAVLKEREGRIQELEANLGAIHNSHGWRALLRYYRLRDSILPANSKRRQMVRQIFLFFNH